MTAIKNDRPDPDSEPIDINAVRADEELIECLRCGRSVPDTDDMVVLLLMAWRVESRYGLPEITADQFLDVLQYLRLNP